jgi:hypothetical protein
VCGYHSEMVHDDDGNPHVVRQMAQQSGISFEPTSGTADADDWEIS